MISLLLLASIAHAGKLSEGWRGLSFGDNPAILGETPPRPEGCTRPDKNGFRWICTEEISGIPFQVSYVVTEGLFVGVMISCEDTTSCTDLRAVAEALYGPGFRPRFSSESDRLRDGFWFEGRAAAGWAFNPYSHKGSLTLLNLDINEEADDRVKARARKAAEDL